MRVLHRDKKAFYEDYFLNEIGVTQYILFRFCLEFDVAISDVLNIRVDDAVNYLRFDCFLSGENDSRSSISKISLNNVTRDLLRKALDNSYGLVYLFSGASVNSNRSRTDKPLTRQSAHKWLSNCHKAHYREDMKNHIPFSWDDLRMMDTSTESYLEVHESLLSVVSERVRCSIESEIKSIKYSLYGSEKDFFKGKARELIKKAEKGSYSKLKFDVGYNSSEFIEHIESFFSEHTGWHNRNTWHIDHIIPLNRFIDTNNLDLKKANALSNLRVLSKTCNLSLSKRLN